MNSTNEPWMDSSNDEEPKAAKRARLASPTPSEPTSEATSEATVQAMECAPCADQDKAINADADDARPFACDQPDCERKYKRLSDLTKHKKTEHDIAIPESYACDQCDYQTKQAGHLTQHKAFKHDLGVTWHKCDLCDYQAKRAGNLTQHKAFKHDIGVRWHKCDLCDYQTKQAGDLTKHKADRHDLGVTWHKCDLCDYQAKQAGNLKTHKAFKHAIGVAWHKCDLCDFKTKHASNLNQHKAFKHSTNVASHKCDQCDYKTKRASALTRHNAFQHDIGVVWHKCDADPGTCDYQCKQASGLQEHLRRCHARVYEQRKKEQEERVRRALLDAGWQEHRLAEAMPPVGFFRREKRIDFKCAKLESRDTWCRIDFVLGVPNGFVFLEVDENQHKYGYGDHLSCDMKRMACVMESLAVETNYNVPNLYWLRYNPNAWHVGGETRRVPKADREANLVAWLERFECVAPFGIGYAFYDCEAPEEEAKEEEDVEDGEPGALDVLGNDEYNPQYAEVAENLMDLARMYGD